MMLRPKSGDFPQHPATPVPIWASPLRPCVAGRMAADRVDDFYEILAGVGGGFCQEPHKINIPFLLII